MPTLCQDGSFTLTPEPFCEAILQQFLNKGFFSTGTVAGPPRLPYMADSPP